MLVPAGFSPGTGVCARGGDGGNSECGGWARLALRFWRSGLPRFTPGLAVLAPTFCLSLRPALRFYRRVLPQFMPGLATLARLLPSVRAFGLAVLAERLSSVCARHCGSIAVFCLGSRLLFAALRQTERLAVSCVPVPPGRDRHSCVLGALFGYLPLWFHFGIVRFICGDLDGVAGNAGLRGLAARPMCAFTQALWPCYAFRGEYAGAKCGSRTAAAPDCAKESNVGATLPPLWTLFTLRRGYVGAYTRRPPGTRKDHRGLDRIIAFFSAAPGYTERPDRL